ncbi:hypothetical protein F4553_001964 [Allocatelliglobosispora scoriae]|uniref:Uncharacterized protein n=1 Tax=Allocatelliglobosispora scoriae TaxID=643052 RepID=A0A841BLR0_9ACTN|nr:hypothetical protein [Allocatelliglobosispora scoriae]MBB5868585.1 hypothetical protein [Allocatelliglobosispora scoriae]
MLLTTISELENWGRSVWYFEVDGGVYLQGRHAQVVTEGRYVGHQRQIPQCPFPGLTPEEILRRLESDETEIRERHWFAKWSEILDNVSGYAYLDDELAIVFAVRESERPALHDFSKVFVARIPP